MTLSHEQLEEVRHYFESQSLSNSPLEDDLLDHCCSGIEELMDKHQLDFHTAFELMKERVVPNGALEIEEDLKYLINRKPEVTMKKFVFAAGYVSSLCFLTGLVLMAMAFFQKQNLSLDQELTSVEMGIQFQAIVQGIEEAAETRRVLELNQAEKALETLNTASSYFHYGQVLMLLAVVIFSFTILPYHFYSRYQRSLGEWQHA